MTGSRLRRLVRSLLCGGVTTLPVMLVACSDAEDPTEMPLRAQCIDTSSENPYAALTFGANADGIAVGQRDAAGTLQRRPSLGTPCANATDRDACNQKVEASLQAATEPSSPIFVLTLGDDVRAIGQGSVLALAAPIETLQEAATVMAFNGSNQLDCGSNNARQDADGWVFRYTIQKTDCTDKTEVFTKVVRNSGAFVTLPVRVLEKSDDSDDCVIAGRRPSRLAPVENDRATATCFDGICRLEAAAVLAFDELARDLASLGAPAELLARLRRAKEEEIAHASITSGLAIRFGGKGEAFAGPALARTEDGRPLLLRLALENAVEGCVREAYGALVAAFQAAHAEDVAVRTVFARIALEETEHAVLSLDLARWLDTRLDGPARLEVARARDRAVAELAVEVALAPADEVTRMAGMPTPAEARGLLQALAA